VSLRYGALYVPTAPAASSWWEWDGDSLVELTLEGEWDGADVQPLADWDGEEV
jgi:hypothetical protein